MEVVCKNGFLERKPDNLKQQQVHSNHDHGHIDREDRYCVLDEHQDELELFPTVCYRDVANPRFPSFHNALLCKIALRPGRIA
jgi:hypothetical protein